MILKELGPDCNHVLTFHHSFIHSNISVVLLPVFECSFISDESMSSFWCQFECHSYQMNQFFDVTHSFISLIPVCWWPVFRVDHFLLCLSFQTSCVEFISDRMWVYVLAIPLLTVNAMIYLCHFLDRARGSGSYQIECEHMSWPFLFVDCQRGDLF